MPLETLELYQSLVESAVEAEQAHADEIEILDNDTDLPRAHTHSRARDPSRAFNARDAL